LILHGYASLAQCVFLSYHTIYCINIEDVKNNEYEYFYHRGLDVNNTGNLTGFGSGFDDVVYVLAGGTNVLYVV